MIYYLYRVEIPPSRTRKQTLRK